MGGDQATDTLLDVTREKPASGRGTPSTPPNWPNCATRSKATTSGRPTSATAAARGWVDAILDPARTATR